MSESFERWIALRRLSVADLPKYGEFPAVYAMRNSATGEILKFGKSSWLRTRIFGQYLGGYDGKRRRTHRELFENQMIDRVELAWVETKDDAEACRKEKEFREAYKKANGKRPKWDLRD